MTGFDDLARRAEQYAKADNLPAAYRGKPASALVAMTYAAALGLDPFLGLFPTTLTFMDGTPMLGGTTMAALVHTAGHRLRVYGDETGEGVVAELIRRDDPDFTFRSVWTVKRAQQVGLAGRGQWRNNATAMLKKRAITEVVRDGAPEVLYGLVSRAGGNHVDAPADLDTETADMPDADTEPRPFGPKAHPDQIRQLGELLEQTGIDRSHRRMVVGELVGTDINGVDDLTEAAAQVAIDYLERIIAEHDPAKSNDPTAEVLAALRSMP